MGWLRLTVHTFRRVNIQIDAGHITLVINLRSIVGENQSKGDRE